MKAPLSALRRSTPLRLTAVLIGIFMLSSLLTFSVAYLVIRNNFDTSLEDQIELAMDSYDAIKSPADLRARLVADAASTDSDAMILYYLSDTGRLISNVDRMPAVDDFTIISDTAIDGDDLADSYRAAGERIGAGYLIFAVSREPIIEMGEIFLSIFLIGLLPTLALASAFGRLAAGRVQVRIDAIRSVLGQLTAGNLSARTEAVDGDIDDLAQIGRAVNHMAAAQQASVASLKQISTDIAHDLKTPIQRVSVLLDRLEKKTHLSEDQKAIVDAALDETDRMVKTFHALLQIAQIEGGSVRDRFEQMDLREIVETFADVYGPSADETGHRLSVQIDGTSAYSVRGDRHLLGQVLANLIENALRHVPAGGIFNVALSEANQAVIMSVADNGPGIPPGERSNVLRRLYRLERSRTTPGNGLGLSLVAAICELHGAVLELADNAPGLLVRIRFPLAPMNERAMGKG
ncbi:sensor histidine kinase [Roseovarius arcticus]|uniref:sensor histidine kinase n=1 Tax=Roseovarius arcticus TaxID=2547404 RepID=UPI001110B69C|nr:HAMP domain-containing sensor histidine kinase [Roseovarius arcticus]